MSVLYFIISLGFAWLAWNLYHPEFKKPRMAVYSFIFGLVVGELPLHTIAFHLFVTWLFGAAGGTSGFFGNLGFLVALVTWASLLWFWIRSFRAEYQMERALEKQLGRHFDDDIVRLAPGISPENISWKRILWPFRQDLPQVEVLKDIQYAEAEGIRLKLDIYRHRSAQAGRPVLLQIHGGGWTHKYGSKNEQARPLMNHLAANGWVCVSIDYRLSPKFTFPDHIIDCKKALVWVKDNIADYGGDPGFIVATGGSAGGHLSSLLALTANNPEFQPGFEDRDTTVQACVPFYGVYDFSNHHELQANGGLYALLRTSVMKKSKSNYPEEYQAASPLWTVHPDAPPFLVIQGTHDTLVSCAEASMFAGQLAETSHEPVVYAELEDAQHGFDMLYSVRSHMVIVAVERFLNYLYQSSRQAQEGSGQ